MPLPFVFTVAATVAAVACNHFVECKCSSKQPVTVLPCLPKNNRWKAPGNWDKREEKRERRHSLGVVMQMKMTWMMVSPSGSEWLMLLLGKLCSVWWQSLAEQYKQGDYCKQNKHKGNRSQQLTMTVEEAKSGDRANVTFEFLIPAWKCANLCLWCLSLEIDTVSKFLVLVLS